MIMTKDNVLVKIKEHFNNVVDIGVKIEIPVDPNNTSQLIATEGTVIKVPVKLSRVPWETSVEVQEGDEVVFSYNAMREAKYRLHSCFEYEGSHYAIIKYHTLIARVREGQITPVNGFCLVKPIKESELPEGIKKKVRLIKLPVDKVSVVFGRVISWAQPNKSYDNKRDVDVIPVPEGNTVVMFQKKSDIVAQYKLQKTLLGSEEVYKIQSRFFLAIIKEE